MIMQRKTTIVRVGVVIGLLGSLTGCDTFRVQQGVPASVRAPAVFMAGIGKVDITPPPGLPLFGYSVQRQQSSVGFRTRLYARAIYLEEPQGGRVALVQCDLGAISALLHRQVGQLVASTTGLSTDRLLLAATHTHSGPGGYFGVVFYNHWGANAAGFDAQTLTFLSQRIARAIQEAYDTRAPAKIGVAQRAVYGLTRNRSLDAYRHNQDVHPPSLLPPDLAPAQQAVDPTFTLIRVDRLTADGTRPLGAFSNFAIHSNILRPRNALYAGDVHAAAERLLEWRLQQHYGVTHTVVHALTNGAEGDAQPAYEPARGFAEAERLGEALSAQAFDLFRSLDGQLTDQVRIWHNYREVPLNEPHLVDGRLLCRQAMVGSPVLGGSEESESELSKLLPFTKEGTRLQPPAGCHQEKLAAGGFLQDLARKDFPTLLTLQTVRLNDLLLLAVPGEMNTEMGWRVKDMALQAARQSGQPVTQVAIVGLANQYLSYFATPEEYAQQHYEGAATLFGPVSGPLIQTQLADLVRQMADATFTPVVPSFWTFRPGERVSYFPLPQAREAAPEAGAVEVSMQPPTPDVRFTWWDGTPGAMPSEGPLVRLDSRDAAGQWHPLQRNGIPEDDRGLHIEVRYLGPHAALGGVGEWRTTWYPASPLPVGTFRFVIVARDGWPELVSEAFQLQP